MSIITRVVTPLALALVAACNRGAPKSAAGESSAVRTPAPELAPDTRLALDSALADLAAPFPVGRLAVLDKWHVMADSAAVPRLYLMYRIAAIHLPSGPITVTLPVTIFRHVRGAWAVVETQIATEPVPPPVLEALMPSLSDTTRTYAFLVRAIPLVPAAPNLVARIRNERDLMTRQGRILMTNGFLSADMEP